MEGGLITMSAKERGRLVVMARVREGKMRIRETSEVLRISYRQGRRIYQRYVKEGDKGLIHRSRGWQSNLPPAKGKVPIQEHLAGSLHLVYRDREVLFKEIDKLPEKRQKISEKPKTTVLKKEPVPSLDHPWRHMSLRSLKRKAAWNYG